MINSSEQFSSDLGAKRKCDNCEAERNWCYQTILNEANVSRVRLDLRIPHIHLSMFQSACGVKGDSSTPQLRRRSVICNRWNVNNFDYYLIWSVTFFHSSNCRNLDREFDIVGKTLTGRSKLLRDCSTQIELIIYTEYFIFYSFDYQF